MRDVKQTKYYLPDFEVNALNTQYYLIYYTLRAEERINHKNKEILVNSHNKETAYKVLLYKNGNLEFSSAIINFKTAYYHRGIFYMEDTYGLIEGKSFNSQEVVFNEAKQQVSANHIVFKAKNKIRIRKNYQISVPVTP